MVKQRKRTCITQSGKNYAINCAIQGVRLIWKQKIWLAICKFLRSLTNQNAWFVSSFCTELTIFCTALNQSKWRNFFMYIITTVIVKIAKKKTKRLTVGKKLVRNLIYLVSSWIFFDVSFDFEAYVVVAFGPKKRNIFACSENSSWMSAMLFALIFPRAKRASTFDIFAERNVWLQSALRSSAIIWKQLSLRSSAIVCDHMESSLYI